MADPAIAAAAAASAADKGGSGGMPQFDVSQWPGQMVWMLIIFVVLYVLFSRVFVPAVAGTINDREDKISADISAARHARDAAQSDMNAAASELSAARGRAQRLALDAQAEAKATAAKRQAEEEAKLATVLAAAEARIADSRAEAMGQVRAIAIDTAQAMVLRLTGSEISSQDIEHALNPGNPA